MILSQTWEARTAWRRRPFTCLLLLGWFGSLAAFAQDASGIKAANIKGADLRLMQNHDPAVEQAHLDLLPGFRANLFAAEPMLANPIHMTWDSRGRLWVACSWAYPQLKPGEVANDKIIILEDTDGDGAADKSTVFAEGLYMPTGIALAKDGCLVAQTPDVFFLRDTDGDDRADQRELALTGFGIEDSHHSISAWRRGPGGYIYFQEGIFLHAQVETPYGVVRNYNGGVYQFDPRSGKLNLFARIGVGNPWGHVFDHWGQSFFVDNPRVSYLSPSTGNSGEKVRLAHLISTEKQCGGDLASGTHLPPELRGQLLTCRFKSRAIIRYEFADKGAGYTARVLPPLVSSRHPNFRPVDCKVGPDGAVYVADWYNSIINHAQHNFRDPRRDHEHGRIWRITHTERPLVEPPTLADAGLAALVDQLRSLEAWTRHQARFELGRHEPAAVQQELEAWVETLDAAAPGYDHQLVEAMWACQNVGRVSEPLLRRVLAAGDGRARAAGARVLRYWYPELSDPVALIAAAAADPFPRVRMEAVLSAGFIPRAEAFAAALHVLDHERDSFIDTAIPQTVTALRPYWEPALVAGTLTFARPEHLAFAEREAGLGFESRLAGLLKSKAPDPDEIAAVCARFGQGATAAQVTSVIQALTRRRGRPSPAATVAWLGALQAVGRRENRPPGDRLPALRGLLSHADPAVAAAAAATLGTWTVREASGDLLGAARDPARASAVRFAAARAVGELGQDGPIDELRQLAAAGDAVGVIGLVAVDLEEAATAAARLLATDTAAAVPLVQAFLQRRRGDTLLAIALADSGLHPATQERIALFHRRTGQLTTRLERAVRSVPAGSLASALLKEPRAELTADVVAHGDPARGELVYRRAELACTTCHRIGSVGPVIGPNLVAVGAAASPEYMVESILQPNAAIAEHYENQMFALADGSVRMGVITFKSEREVVIRDSARQGRETRIPAADILRTTPLPSLMPAGLADQLADRQEFLDLARFLSVLGRPGPWANDERPLIRAWEIADQRDAEAWTPVTSLVNGELPAADLLPINSNFVRASIEVQSAGMLALKLNDPTGLRLWLDDRQVSLTDPLVVSPGSHRLTIAIDCVRRGNTGLRVEVAPAGKTPARFQLK